MPSAKPNTRWNPVDRNEQLRQALNRLSARQAAALAQTVELQRSLGKAVVPTEAILDGVRPFLRDTRPQRHPTLCRLVCNGFEPFLTDREDEPRIEGLIPRAAIEPWWAAVRHVARDDIAALEDKLIALLAAEPSAALDGLEQDAQRSAARWSAAIVSELKRPRPAPDLIKCLPGAFVRDARVIARILPMSHAIAASLKALTRMLARLDAVDGDRIRELAPDAVTLLKQHYLALSEDHGTDARYLALAVTNRLVQPCQILRLGRALSWKPTDSLVAGTEFAWVGGRIVGDLQRLSRVIVSGVARREAVPAAALSRQILRYMNESEALLGEIGFRRDSAWGEAILQTRAELADALQRNLLPALVQRVLAAMPPSRSGAAPARETLAEAVDAAGLLQLLARRGQRHGFAQAAREALNAACVEAEARTDSALRRLCRDPIIGESVRPQIEGAAMVFDILFEEGRGQLLLRQLANALRASA
jgi:hypothetical protein